MSSATELVNDALLFIVSINKPKNYSFFSFELIPKCSVNNQLTAVKKK